MYLQVDRKRSRESDSGGSADSGSHESDWVTTSDSEEDSSSGVSSYSGSNRGQRQRKLDWRPSHQVSAPPPRVASLMEDTPIQDLEIQEAHSWSGEDTSPNIYIKTEDGLTFHRNPAYQTTDAIRGKGGPDLGDPHGLHVWKITWPQESRGTHPVVGVATRECHLTEAGYKRLVGSTGNSWGWCLKSLKIYHDSRKYRNGVPYPRDIDEKLKVPNSFHMILDMDRGTLAFQVFCVWR